MSSTTSKVRQYEGSVRIKGYNIAYILWLPPVDDQSVTASVVQQQLLQTASIDPNDSTVLKYTSKVDPIALSSHFEHTMLCLHGWLDNSNSYSRLAPLLVRRYRNLRVIAIDWPGHGKSSHSPLGYYDRGVFATTVLRFLHRINCRSNLHLVGHSMGAVWLPYYVPILAQDARNVYQGSFADKNDSNGSAPSSRMHDKLFDIQSLICLEQFGAARFDVSYDRTNLSNIQYLLPSPEEEVFEDEMEGSDAQQDAGKGAGAAGSNSRRFPKLYDSVDEIVRSRVWVTKEMYPGKQWIHEASAKMILERNIGSVLVVESGGKRKKVRKYYLRTDPVWRSSSDPIGRMFPANLKDMYTTLIPKIECPTMALFAEFGWPGLDAVAVHCKEKLGMKNLQVERVEGSHHVHIDAPQVVMDKIAPFLDKIINSQQGNQMQKEFVKSKL